MEPPLDRPPASPPPSGVPPPAIDEAAFRSLMGRFATGVTVVTSHHRGRDVGMTVNAFLSVSLEPPTLLVSLSSRADTTPVVETSGRFAVTVLAASQRHLSDLFASRLPSSEKFQGVPFHRGPGGLALLDGGLAAFECEVVQRIPYASHILYLGRVVYQEHGPRVSDLPLVFWKSDYARPSQGEALVMSPSRPLSASPKEKTAPRGKGTDR